jgi:hypothetical protein
MNTIAAINDIFLPVVLFVIYFCFASIVQYNLKDKTSVSTFSEVTKASEKAPKVFTYKDAFSAEYDPDPVPEIKEKIAGSVESKVEEIEAPVAVQIPESQSSSSLMGLCNDSQNLLSHLPLNPDCA